MYSNSFISFIYQNQQLIAGILSFFTNLKNSFNPKLEIEAGQEAIVVFGEASESEDDSDKSDYRSDSSPDSRSNSNSSENLAFISLNSAKSANSNRSANSISNSSRTGTSFLVKKLSIREDRFAGNESNLINERLIKDNRLFRNAIIGFGTQRYQQTINELNELNQSLIKSQEKIQTANQHIEKTKANLNHLNENLNQIFKSFNNCRLKI